MILLVNCYAWATGSLYHAGLDSFGQLEVEWIERKLAEILCLIGTSVQ